MERESRHQAVVRAADLVRLVAKHKGIDTKAVKTVPMVDYPTADDYYAIFGANPELWLNDWKQIFADTESILKEYSYEVIRIQINQRDYLEWLNGAPSTKSNRMQYALHLMDQQLQVACP